MSRGPDHEDLRELLPPAALGILEEDELELVLVHVRDCEMCARTLDEYREALGLLALALPQKTMDPSRSAVLSSRLLTRVREERLLEPAGTEDAPADFSRAILIAERWTGWLVAAALAGLLINHHAFHRPLDYGWIMAGVLSIALVVLGLYARVQRKRVSALLKRLGESDRSGTR